MTDTATRVRQVIARQLCQPIDELPDDRTFVSMKADSLDGIELAMELEDEFSIAIPDGDIEEAQTVGAAIAVVERVLGEKEKAPCA
jgi:Acyl carrier protein